MRAPSASCLLVLVSLSFAVACGSEAGDRSSTTAPGGEAPGGDALPGAPADPDDARPAAPAPVVVSVLGVNGLPEVGVAVVFHDANGDVLGEAKTDAAGKASSAGGPPPAMVSALLGNARARHVLTWTTVKAGDVLETKNITWGDDPVGAYAVSLPGAMPGAQHYRGYTAGCSGFSESAASAMSIGVSPDCMRPGNTNSVLVVAVGDLAKPIGYAYAKELVGPVDTKTEVTTSAFQPLDAVDVVLTNLAPELSADTEVLEEAGGVLFARGFAPVKGEKGTFDVAAAFADSLQIHASASGETLADGWHTVAKRVAPTTTTTTVDFGSNLPTITSRAIDQSDAPRPSIRWEAASSLAATDGGHVSIVWYPSDQESAGWTLLVAPGATSVKLPALPASAAAFVPPATPVMGPRVLFVESDAFADHDAFRRVAGRIMPLGTELGLGFTVRHTVLPATATTLRGTER